jgi:hypothetical protein
MACGPRGSGASVTPRPQVYCPRCETPCIEDADHFAQCARCLFAFCSLCCGSWHPGARCLDEEQRLLVMSRRRARGGAGAKDTAAEMDLVGWGGRSLPLAGAHVCRPGCANAAAVSDAPRPCRRPARCRAPAPLRPARRCSSSRRCGCSRRRQRRAPRARRALRRRRAATRCGGAWGKARGCSAFQTVNATVQGSHRAPASCLDSPGTQLSAPPPSPAPFPR